MSNFTPNPQQPQDQQVRIDPNSPNVRCPNCDNQVFQPLFIAKKISALTSPNGKEAVAPMQIFACTNCGAVPKEFGASLLEKDEKTVNPELEKHPGLTLSKEPTPEKKDK